MRTALILAVVALVPSACALGPDYKRPPVVDVTSFRESFPPGASIADLAWWEVFGDSVLQDLIEEALAGNRDLRVAVARINESRAVLGIVRSDLFPRVDYSGGVARDGDTDDRASTTGGVGFSAAYQVDLWGRIRRSNEAALEDLLASEEAYRSLTITIVAEVARAYLVLRDLDNRITISEQTAEARRKSLNVVRTRFDAGVVSEVDVNQAEIQLYQAEAAVYSFERLRGQTENAISALLGRAPMSIPRGLALTEQPFTPEVPPGLPSELLERRPDILAAEHSLHAQTARIGVAEALKFPQLTLTGDVSAQFADKTTGVFGFAAQIFGPLFNAGANRRRVDVEVARTEGLINSYEQTIFNALRETEDAMIAVRTYQGEFDARQRQVTAAQQAAELSWVRYEGGLTSFLEVLDIERSLFSAQLEASETLQLQLTSIVRLYETLGGGWSASDAKATGGENNE